MIKMKGLGRGLDALLAGSDARAEDELRNLPVDRLKPGKYQPRTHMDQASLAELAASIKAQGVMQPILVRAIDSTPGAERYEIVAGERRWRAAQLAGLSEVPVLVRRIPDEQALEMALIENIQRENLNPLEEAQGLLRLIDEFGLTHQQAADAVVFFKQRHVLFVLQQRADQWWYAYFVGLGLQRGGVDVLHHQQLEPVQQLAGGGLLFQAG